MQGPVYAIAPRCPARSKGNPFAYVCLKNLSGRVRKERIVAGGSYADLWVGYLDTDSTSTPIKVAIKQLRQCIYSQADIAKLEKRLRREVRIWGNLNHPNIVPLLGIISDFGQSPAMVCQWMSQGSLQEYLENQKEKLTLQDRLNICIFIAEGLSYLHSQKVIHGDLTPGNILMDKDIAFLSDLGISNVIAGFRGPSFATTKIGGSARWIAPELCSDETELYFTTASDVYSFASVAFYVVTGTLPYAHLSHERQIMFQITVAILRNDDTVTSLIPSTSARSLLPNECWTLFSMCWATDPVQRPSIDYVKNRLQKLL